MKLNLASYALIISLIHCSSQYMEYNIEDRRLCDPLSNIKRKIKLGKEYNSGLIINHDPLSYHVIDWIQNVRCRFRVTPSSSDEGIIAVIQHLNFRKNPITNECIDYVQFMKKDGIWSQRFCGYHNTTVDMENSFTSFTEHFLYETAFVDEHGELDVIIFVDKKHLPNDEKMNISIVFTAFRSCGRVFKKDRTYQPCNETSKKYCIYSGFFSDLYINCPSPTCLDKDGCIKDVSVDYFNGNKVLIGAVSSVFVVFAIFILCLWICKTYHIFCWSQNFANPSTATPQNEPSGPLPRVIELNEQTQSRSSVSQVNSTSAGQIDEDKDLPPSYESLFPSR